MGPALAMGLTNGKEIRVCASVDMVSSLTYSRLSRFFLGKFVLSPTDSEIPESSNRGIHTPYFILFFVILEIFCFFGKMFFKKAYNRIMFQIFLFNCIYLNLKTHRCLFLTVTKRFQFYFHARRTNGSIVIPSKI